MERSSPRDSLDLFSDTDTHDLDQGHNMSPQHHELKINFPPSDRNGKQEYSMGSNGRADYDHFGRAYIAENTRSQNILGSLSRPH